MRNDSTDDDLPRLLTTRDSLNRQLLCVIWSETEFADFLTSYKEDSIAFKFRVHIIHCNGALELDRNVSNKTQVFFYCSDAPSVSF